ncbi:hypothetical protein IT570_06580 [Candidatus Sumerlaeota bacterium]|nr:hypothetical protein [Candidatus Sumerlaeota bacterium]
MMILRQHRKGYAILSMLIVLVIIGVLTQGYFSVDAPGGKMWVVSQQDRARSAVAQVNFRTAQTEYFMRTEGRQLPINELRSEMERLANFSKDGRFFVDQRGTLSLTSAMETRKFADRMQLPRSR